MGYHRSLSVLDVSDLVSARMEAREAARQLGAGRAGATLAATVVSELARNLIRHAGGGQLTLALSEGTLLIETKDHGPGIACLELALTPGYSTDGSAGLGLAGIARVARALDIKNANPDGLLVRVELSAERLGVPSRYAPSAAMQRVGAF